jgi:predicted ATPase
LIAGFDFRADGGGEALEFGVVEEGGGGIVAKEVQQVGFELPWGDEGQ